jgi:ABC-type branched-subunit amino acid transport system ATPase component/ABC-type branched-subunit amino acid transport system permease subunit
MIIGDAKSRTKVPSLVIVCAVGVAGVTLPIDDSLKYTLIAAMGWAVAAVGLDLLVGYSGQPSFGQAAFVAVGAYLVTALRIHFELPLLFAVVAGVGATGLLALALGSVMVRLRIFGMAVTTLFFGYVVFTVLMGDALADYFGGANGLPVPTFPFGDGTTDNVLYLAAAVILGLVVLVTCNLTDSQTGRAMRMAKSNEAVAAANGIPVRKVKVIAFAYCCMLAAIGGVIYSAVVGYLGPESFTMIQSVSLFAMVVVGGTGTVGGPVLGALLITVLPGYFLRDGHSSAILFAAALLFFLILLPEGLFGLAQRLGRMARDRLRAWVRLPMPRLRPAPDPAAGVGAWSAPGWSPDEDDPDGAALEVRDLEVRFADFVALSEVSITVHPGSVHAVVGPNGAGKTTLLNTVSGLYQPARGTVLLAGERIDTLAPREIRRRGVARTFQTPTVVSDLDVIDNVKLGLDADDRGSLLADLAGGVATGRRERIREGRARWALDAVGIPADRWRRQVRSLDLSEQRRVELARGLVSRSRLLLLDEPTAGLSVKEMDALAALLREIHARFRLTFVVISHHIGFVLDIADELTVLDYGQVVGNGEPAAVLARPEIAATFTGAPPQPRDEPVAVADREG